MGAIRVSGCATFEKILGHGLAAGRYPELFVNLTDMRVDRRVRDLQFVGDFPIAMALGQKLEHAGLFGRQRLERSSNGSLKDLRLAILRLLDGIE